MQVLPSPEYPFMQLHVNSPGLAFVHVANKGWQSSLAEPQAGGTKLHNYIIHRLLNIKITKLFCNYYLGVHIFYLSNRLISRTLIIIVWQSQSQNVFILDMGIC